MTFQSDRRFELWDYSPSHSRLLLRSPRNQTEGTTTNLDVIFRGVDRIDLPTLFHGLTITEDPEQVHPDREPGQYLVTYLLRTATGEFRIDALRFSSNENRMEIFDSPLDSVHD